MSKQEPKLALITGAAGGIGQQMARVCAGKGWSVVLVDINEEKLNEFAEILRGEFSNIQVYPFKCNLSEQDAAEQCLAFCDENHLEVDFLVNNAGVYFFDPLIDADMGRVTRMIDIHMRCVTKMCMLFGARMKQRRFGYILNMSSMSAWMAMPGISVYNASKAYVRSMSRAIYFELKPWNVHVTAVCPGGINTPLFNLPENLRNMAVRFGFLMQPEKLAKKAIKATLKKKIQTIPGLSNHFWVFLIQRLPNWLVTFIMKHLKVYDRFWKEPDELEK
ncbi:MAG: SDR family NAD(P)-dependent oxidoreductase [Proteobacteria bacterium]|nr:SDR family NAD(P)-dependent oxidoreductase [Pseudomonadota bacterium]